jgi:hypothetical protein
MKALKILGGMLGALALAALVFWLGWLRAPDGAEVCENVIRVLGDDAGKKLPEKIEAEIKKDCERRARPPEFGRVPWVKRMKCMRDAGSRKDLEACDKAG